MENKGYAKRIICLAVCLVLALAACIIGHDFNAVCVGSGSSSNAEINSMKQMGEMMDAFTAKLGGYDMSYWSDDAVASDAKYKSFTVKEISSTYYNIKRNDGTFSNATYQRFMTVGITNDAMFYHSEYTVSSDMKSSGNSESDGSSGSTEGKAYVDAAVDCDVYVSSERMLIRFNNITFARNGKNLYGFERVVGQWGDFSEDRALGLNFIYSFCSSGLDYKIMSLIGSYVSRYQAVEFRTKGSTHSMKRDMFKVFSAQLMSTVCGSAEYLSDGFTGGMEIDLGSSTSPIITLDFKNSYVSDSSIFDSNRASVEMSETDVLEFSNINNTVIKGYDDVSTISAEKFSEIMEELK